MGFPLVEQSCSSYLEGVQESQLVSKLQLNFCHPACQQITACSKDWGLSRSSIFFH